MNTKPGELHAKSSIEQHLEDAFAREIGPIRIDLIAAHLDAGVPEPEEFSAGDRFTPELV